MECPKCGEDNLIGARKCMACGADMFGDIAPPPVLPPAARAKPEAQEDEPDPAAAFPALHRSAPPSAAAGGGTGMETAVCSTCTQSFERFAGDTGQTKCMKCRAAELKSPAVGGTSPEDEAGVVAFGQRMGTSAFRPKPVEKTAGIRWGPILGFLLVAGGGGGAFLHFRKAPDRTRDMLQGLRAEAAQRVVTAKAGAAVEIETRLRLHVRHASKKGFGTTRETIVDARFEAVQLTDIEFVRDDPAGTVTDVMSRCSTASQTGTVPDGARLNPWEGHSGSTRVAIAASGPPKIVGGGAPLVGQDVPPLLSLATVGAPAALQPGDAWTATVTLPLLAGPDGRLVNGAFPCNLTYLGIGQRKLYDCVGIHLAGTAPATPPAGMGDTKTVAGKIRAALFFAADTGFLVEATMDVDLQAADGEESQTTVEGTLTATRR